MTMTREGADLAHAWHRGEHEEVLDYFMEIFQGYYVIESGESDEHWVDGDAKRAVFEVVRFGQHLNDVSLNDFVTKLYERQATDE